MWHIFYTILIQLVQKYREVWYEQNPIPWIPFFGVIQIKYAISYFMPSLAILWKKWESVIIKENKYKLNIFLTFKTKLMLLKFTIKRNRISPKMAGKSQLEI